MRHLLILVLAWLLVPVATAHGGWKMDRARAIAATVWANPCDDDVVLQWRYPKSERLENAHAWTSPGRCDVTLHAGKRMPWGEFCTVLIHEYGHLAGYRDPRNTKDPYHSLNPRSVMHASTWFFYEHGEVTAGADRRCRKRGRPYLEARGLMRPGRQRVAEVVVEAS